MNALFFKIALETEKNNNSIKKSNDLVKI